ncbi:MAG TPA: HD domain-containing phosphohydrolase [Anaerolineales bacterium]|nr:HD domain-containing phosphohydrolase [Anaerolineales bacterium]
MAEPYDAQFIQKELDDVNKLLMKAMTDLARINDGQTSLVLRDLTQVTSSIKNLKNGIIGYLDENQKHVMALVGVGSVINSSLGLKQVLEEVMDRLIALMGAERGFLMLREPSGELNVRIARGIDREDLNKEAFAVSNTIVRRAIETGEAILTTNAQNDPRFGGQDSVAAYHLLSILCAPLKIKDDLIGVIYVDNRAHSGIFRTGDLGLISAFANQAAVAIDNASLFDDLQESNAELEIAYQATLEGWVRALDLRDKETEGHTKRVTMLTRRLAQEVGVDDEALLHITRGALLHDIGKMAIPDGILLKPGGLSQEERMLIQKHPVYAHEMLSPIKFLHPALDIPYCHHEKWDGSGYPRGLKGEGIPFAARIFAIIDVWDALVSDRPYRKGIDPAEVKNMITQQSGIHFEPRLVDAFLKMDVAL